MRSFVLASLFALVAGHRVDTRAVALTEILEEKLDGDREEAAALAEVLAELYEEAAADEAAEQEEGSADEVEVTGSAQGPYVLNKIQSLKDFNKNPTLLPELTPKAGESLIFSVEEKRSAFKNSAYNWYVIGRNREEIEPVELGRLKHSANAFSGKFTFESKHGEKKVFSLKKKQSNAFANAFIGKSVKSEKYYLNSENGKDTYYTIEKSYKGGRRGGSGHFGGGGHYGGGHRYGRGRQEYITIYKGMCKKKCGNPVYTGSGAKKGQYFDFFRYGQPDTPVCRVDRDGVKRGWKGRSDQFIMTVEENTDSVAMLAAVSINDALNNIEENRD